MEKLIAQLNALDIKLQLDGRELRIIAPHGALTEALRQELRQHKQQIIDLLMCKQGDGHAPLPTITPDKEHLHEPFALTDLQHAYWLGRDSTMEMGGVATHLYVEFDCSDIAVDRLNSALCRMIEHHDMLRAVVGGDGMQRILPEVPPYHIAITDCSKATPEVFELAVANTREALSHQVLQPDHWPLFDIRATLLPDSRLRLHVSLDLLILDASSIYLFFLEWHAFYANPCHEPQALEISFRDCVLAERSMQDTTSYRRSYAYWMNRIDTLPAAPTLPLRSNLLARKAPRFSRREAKLDKVRWERLKANVRSEGLTPSGLLLALYSEVLARWSLVPHFTVNVTVSSRPALHPNVNRLLGDFTSLMMHEVDHRDQTKTFLEFARGLQTQFFNDLQNRQVSGLAVLREWVKRRGLSLQASMPVVFSSGLIGTGDEEVGNLERFGQKVYSISQTSQVWLDHHVVEVNGELVFNWDAADAVFEDGVLDAMFAAYCNVVERFADDANVPWGEHNVVSLPPDMQSRRDEANNTILPLPQRCLHSGFVVQARARPSATAVVSPSRTMTYGDLLRESIATADWLITHGVQRGQIVGILMHKGWEQVVAVYGVLLAGAVYMPVDADLPPRRQLELLRIGEARHVLVQPGRVVDHVVQAGFDLLEIQPGARGDWGPNHEHSLDVSRVGDLAYVIFTSGTTGVPKGVMIDHRGAVNTVEHINRMFRIGPLDRVLAVSSLSFDLSVYDIFGLHDAGGALVIPDVCKGHDPTHWRDLISEQGITLWNSAPQLMSMLMDSFNVGGQDVESLRIVLLSGDFIPLDLPERIHQRSVHAEVVSLGGATEASIWSIFFPITALDPSWINIPYGKPLPNQSIWVLDTALRPCPDYVKGRIYIGGKGLALGYWRDAQKTSSRFVIHTSTGVRLYDTGDLGYYAADGNVMILGRDDGQVKIRGHRVELGEIEAVLNQHCAIKQSVVILANQQTEKRQLVAYVESADASVSTQSIKVYLAERLPDYMIPTHMVLLAKMPLSANGKIDYRSLPAVETGAKNDTAIQARDEVEQSILQAWSRVIGESAIGVNDNFFELGGDSIMATQLVRELNAVLPMFNIEMHELFENLTIESLASLYRSRTDPPQTVEQSFYDKLAAAKNLMLADIQAAKDGFKQLYLANRRWTPGQMPAAARAILLTGGTGWIGAHVLSELLSLTQAKIYCLVRSSASTPRQASLMEAMRRCDIPTTPSWIDRIEPVIGDLGLPKLGLTPKVWEDLCKSVDAIYHLGAYLDVMTEYAEHRQVNVISINSVVHLAIEHHAKPVFFTSPMAVCRRHKDNGVTVLYEEKSHADPQGLPTGYAQSKWVAEQILLEAAALGLPVKIYRTSHALPSARNGMAKSGDTYVTALQVACTAGASPDWAESAVHGVPVDILARLIVENSLAADPYCGIIHLENRTPLSFQSVVNHLLEIQADGVSQSACVEFGQWAHLCLDAAERLPQRQMALAKFLFMDRPTGPAVKHIFKAHPIDTSYFDALDQRTKLCDLSPAEYWKMVKRNAEWQVCSFAHMPTSEENLNEQETSA